MPEMDDRPEPRLLRGWKEIGAHLGAAPRSAQRYAAEMGLPVHRAGQRRGSVSAFTDELDVWVRRRTEEAAMAGPPDASASGDSTAGADEPGPQGPSEGATAEAPARGWTRALRTATVVGVAVMATAGWLGLGRARAPGVTDARATRAERAGQTAGGQYILRVTYPDGSAMNVSVTEQSPAMVQLSAGQTLILQPSPSGALLRIDLFEKDGPVLADGARRLVGTAELVASRADAPISARLVFSSGVLDVAWIEDPAP